MAVAVAGSFYFKHIGVLGEGQFRHRTIHPFFFLFEQTGHGEFRLRAIGGHRFAVAGNELQRQPAEHVINDGVGYALGLVAGMVAVPWFVWTESALRPWNSWLFFNYAGPMDSGVGAHAFVTLKILSVTLIVITVICSALRLLPGHWSLRESPLRRRTWPAVTAGPLVLAVWYARSVTPYSVPIIVDGASPEFQILHVEKRGLRFHKRPE